MDRYDPDYDPELDEPEEHGLGQPYGFELCPTCRSGNVRDERPFWSDEESEDDVLLCEDCGTEFTREEAL